MTELIILSSLILLASYLSFRLGQSKIEIETLEDNASAKDKVAEARNSVTDVDTAKRVLMDNKD